MPSVQTYVRKVAEVFGGSDGVCGVFDEALRHAEDADMAARQALLPSVYDRLLGEDSIRSPISTGDHMPTREEQELLAMAARHAQQTGQTVSGIDAALGGMPVAADPLQWDGAVTFPQAGGPVSLPEPQPQVRTASTQDEVLEHLWETPQPAPDLFNLGPTTAPPREMIEELFEPDPALAGVYGVSAAEPAGDISELFMTGEAAQAAEAGVPSAGPFLDNVAQLAGDNFDISFGDDNDLDAELAGGGLGPPQRFASSASSPRFRVDRGLPQAPAFTGRVDHGGGGRVVSRREGGQFQTLSGDQVRAEARARLETRHSQARVAETRAQAQRAQATRTASVPVRQQAPLVQRPAPTPRTSGTIYDRISKGGLNLD